METRHRSVFRFSSLIRGQFSTRCASNRLYLSANKRHAREREKATNKRTQLVE